MTKSSMSSFSQQLPIDPKILAQWTSKKQDRRTLIVFFLLALFFTLLGLLLVVSGSSIKEYSLKYSSVADCLNKTCTVELNIEEKMDAPVYFYYHLGSFFQNHQRYISSKDKEQLAGKNKPVTELSSCHPIITNADAGVTKSVMGTDLNPNATAIPCGLIAYTIFPDNFTMKNKASQKDIELHESGIAWTDDVEGSDFKNIDLSKQWINMEKERFINWMRLAGLSSFKKLWGIIDEDLEPGVYEITVGHQPLTKFEFDSVENDKWIVVSTANKFGGKNMLLSVCYLVAAAISWIIFAAFSVRMIRKSKKL